MPTSDSADAGEWEKFVDDGTNTPYYYNTRTGESSWDVPAGYVAKEEAESTENGAKSDDAHSRVPSKPPRWKRFIDETTGKPYYYDAANDVTQWDEPVGDVEDASDSDEEEEEDEGEESVGEDREEEKQEEDERADGNKQQDDAENGEKAATNENEAAPDVAPLADSTEQETTATEPTHQWVKHVDKSTGKPYYHDAISGATQWDEPEQYTTPTLPQAPVVSAEYLEYLHRSRAERLARATQKALDPSGNLSRLNALLSKIEHNSGSAEAEAPEDVEQSLQERASAEWQQHLDPHTHRYYYHNIATGETQWQTPDAPVASALADWVPPATLDNTATANTSSFPKRTVSGIHYAASAKFNRVSGKFEKLGGDDHWQAKGIAGDREGRQMSHFFDVKQLEKNRADAQRIKEELKRKNVDWKKVGAEKKAKKQKRKNEWIYQE